MRKRFIILAVLVVVIPAYAISEYPYHVDQSYPLRLSAEKFIYSSNEPITVTLKNISATQISFAGMPRPSFIHVTSMYDGLDFFNQFIDFPYEPIMSLGIVTWESNDAVTFSRESLPFGVYIIDGYGYGGTRIFILVV